MPKGRPVVFKDDRKHADARACMVRRKQKLLEKNPEKLDEIKLKLCAGYVSRLTEEKREFYFDQLNRRNPDRCSKIKELYLQRINKFDNKNEDNTIIEESVKIQELENNIIKLLKVYIPDIEY